MGNQSKLLYLSTVLKISLLSTSKDEPFWYQITEREREREREARFVCLFVDQLYFHCLYLLLHFR